MRDIRAPAPIPIRPGTLTLVQAEGRLGSQLLARLALARAPRLWVGWISLLEDPEDLGRLRRGGVHVMGGVGTTVPEFWTYVREGCRTARFVVADGIDHVHGDGRQSQEEVTGAVVRILGTTARVRGFEAAATCRAGVETALLMV